MLGNISFFVVFCWLFSKINFFKKFFQEHCQSVKQFGSRSVPTFCWSWSGSKLFAKVISRWQKSPLATIGLNAMCHNWTVLQRYYWSFFLSFPCKKFTFWLDVSLLYIKTCCVIFSALSCTLISALFDAVEHQDLDAVKEILVTNGVDINRYSVILLYFT